MRQELGAMKLMGLQKRALGAGVSEDELEDAMEADEPKAALISLIVLSELSSRAVVAAEPAAAELEQQQGVDTWQDNEDEEGQVSDGGKKKKGKKSKNKSPTAAEIAAVRQTEQNRTEKKRKHLFLLPRQVRDLYRRKKEEPRKTIVPFLFFSFPHNRR